MRRRGLASLLLVGLSGVAVAQPVDTPEDPAEAPPSRPAQMGYGALPGGLHAPNADTLPTGTVAVMALGGFGYRKDLLGPEHSFMRGIGNLALSFAPLSILTIGLTLDGRMDKHYGVGQDDGFVGDPRLIARLGKAVSPALKLGGQLTLWVPGKDAPSVAGSATSVDVRALSSITAGPGTLGISAGFRLDNSRKSIEDADLMLLSNQDKVSLGISDWNSALVGIAYTVPVGAKAFFTAEASTDIFVGDGAPSPIFRVGASGGLNLTDSVSLLAYVEGAKVPGMNLTDVTAGAITLVPYEPIITGGLGFQARFGGPKKQSGRITENEEVKPVAVIEYASVTGIVVDDTGKPVVGAIVTVKLAKNTGTDATDETGAFTVDQLPIGETLSGTTTLDDTGAEVTVAVDGKKPAKQTLSLVKGANQLPQLVLESELPPGQLRAVVRAAGNGKPLAGATVTIEPGGVKATSGPDGSISVDLPPGTYKATVEFAGYKAQTLDVVIEENGVAVKNFELNK